MSEMSIPQGEDVLPINDCERLCAACPNRNVASRTVLRLVHSDWEGCESGPVADFDNPYDAANVILVGADEAYRRAPKLCGRDVESAPIVGPVW